MKSRNCFLRCVKPAEFSPQVIPCNKWLRRLQATTAYKWFQRQQHTTGGPIRSSRPAHCCQHIPSNRFLDGVPDPIQFAAVKLTHYSSKPQRPSLLAIIATQPALRRCIPEPWPYYKVSMSGMCSQCHRSWGELFIQSLFWMSTFEVFWSSKRSRVQTN